MVFTSKFVTLNNGLQMPALGIGTWRAPDEEVENAIEQALEAGYRHIDCSPIYFNEEAVGRTLRRWLDAGRVKRDELFIVTKLPPNANRPSELEQSLTDSLTSLQLDYVDVYLIHMPISLMSAGGDVQQHENGEFVLDVETSHAETWKKMEEMVSKGLTKSIGVSNFNKIQVERLMQNATIKPAILQIEMHVYLQQIELIEFCKNNNIIVTAYSPLGSKGIEVMYEMAGVERKSSPDLLENSTVVAIAKRHRKTPAQVLIKWILQQGVVTIPKSTNAQRLRQNFDVYDFVLTTEDNTELRRLDAGIRVCDLGFVKGAEKHPEFPWHQTQPIKQLCRL